MSSDPLSSFGGHPDSDDFARDTEISGLKLKRQENRRYSRDKEE
jgi:hypothetical protein